MFCHPERSEVSAFAVVLAFLSVIPEGNPLPLLQLLLPLLFLFVIPEGNLLSSDFRVAESYQYPQRPSRTPH